jgi:multicomponent Na+:H+ antiporter subunit F
MNTVTSLCFGILAGAAALAVVRAIRPTSSLADRIVAIDLLLVTLVGATGVVTARRGDDMFLDLAVVAALLGFVGTVTVARYIERRGA